MKKIIALIAAFTMLLSATACSQSSQSASTSGTANNASTDTQSSSNSTGNVETIKIGWLAPLTGTAAENGQQVTWAAEMIVDLVNQKRVDVDMLLAADAGLPNLNGAQIKLVKADTKGDTTVATSEAKRLISEEGCVALTG